MNAAPLVESAVALEAALRHAGLSFCFIGGIAVLRWGEVRTTRDLDVTVMADFGKEAVVVDKILHQLTPRVSDAREFALLNRVLLVRDQRGTPIDIALGAMPFEARTVERSSAFEIAPNQWITTCSAEDLVIHKAFAGRDKDSMDIRGILKRNAEWLDWGIIEGELTALVALTEDRTPLERLAMMREG